MSSPSVQSEAPLERLRIEPWRGAVHFLVLISSATLAVSLLLSYVLLVAMTFVWICVELHAITKTMAINGLMHWNLIQDWMMFLGLGVTWVFMLRPLRPRPSGTRVALQVTHGTQPQLYDLAKDRGESTNLAAKHADIVERMSKALLAWHASMPADNGPALGAVKKPK
jgi:hypothetical protein